MLGSKRIWRLQRIQSCLDCGNAVPSIFRVRIIIDIKGKQSAVSRELVRSALIAS